jgi:hypothetical protein
MSQYAPTTCTTYIPAGPDCEVSVVLGKDLIDRTDLGLTHPSRRYKHCGQFVVTLELLPESITNEGRIPFCESAHTSYRADCLRVIDIRHITGHTVASIASDSNDNCVYRAGEIVRSAEFWMNGDEQCCPWGIHYFRTMEGVYGRMLYRNFVTLEVLRNAWPVVDRAVYWDSLGLNKLVDCCIARET